MDSRLKKFFRTIVFLSTGLIILYWVYYRQNQAYLAECALQGIAEEECSLIGKVIEDFRHAEVWVLILVVFFFMISNISRALRWQMLMKPLGINARLQNSFLTIMLGYFANLGLPRVGEVIRAATLARYEKVKFDKVMGTVIVDRVMDVILMAVFMVIALIGAAGELGQFIREHNALGDKFRTLVLNPVFIAMLLALIIMIVFLFRSRRFRSSAAGKRLREFFKGMIDGLKSIASLKRPWLFVFHSLIIWLMYYLMLYVGFSAFQPTAHLGPMAGVVVFTMGSLGIVIPSPGGMGTYHFLVTAGLQMYGLSGADGFSFANILFFTIQIFGNIFFGILALVILPALNRNYMHDARNLS